MKPERTPLRFHVRPDLGEALHALKPAFFRFSGEPGVWEFRVY